MYCVTQSNFLVVPLHNEWIIIKVTKVEMHYEGLRSLPSPKSIRHSLSIIKDRKKSTAKTLTSIWRNWNRSKQKIVNFVLEILFLRSHIAYCFFYLWRKINNSKLLTKFWQPSNSQEKDEWTSGRQAVHQGFVLS